MSSTTERAVPELEERPARAGVYPYKNQDGTVQQVQVYRYKNGSGYVVAVAAGASPPKGIAMAPSPSKSSQLGEGECPL